ncbi:MAG: hypothetical protein ACYS8W_00515 [Planctomycetota bacterium]|jgi:hypothetical protein
MRVILSAICLLPILLFIGCALKPVNVRDNSKRFPTDIPPIGRYQVIPPALTTPIGMAYGPKVEKKFRSILGSAVSPDESHALYITDLTMKEEKRNGRLIVAVEMQVDVHLEPGSGSKPVFRVDVSIEAEFEPDVRPEKARESAARAAAAALAKQLP